ncbi:MAG: hypothetical protein QNK70_04175 [Crocinitomicaceae bacterium]
MRIQTIDELLDFIETNYEKLSNKAYVDICRTTMHLYEYRKPSTKEKTLERIKKLYELNQKYASVQEMPLFLS